MAWIWASSILLILLLWLLIKKKKKLPPGPIGLPIIGHFHLLGKNPHQDLHKLARKHGPFIHLRFGFIPAFIVSSPATAELILKTHDAAFAGRPQHQASKYLSYGGRNIVFAQYGDYWRNMRKLVTLELLSPARINQFRPIRKEELDSLIRVLKSVLGEIGGTGGTVNLSAGVSKLNGDLMCRMVFGRKFEGKEVDPRGFKAVVDETMAVAARPNVGDYFPFMAAADVQGLDRRMKELSKRFDGFLEGIIEEHCRHGRRGKKEDGDFVDTLMAVLELGKAGFEFDRRHVKAVLMDMFIGGMDTSSAAIEWTMSEIIRHPIVMDKLQKELENVVGMNQMVEESHLDQLEYLNMVIKEALRLHSVVPLLFHEPMEDYIVNGFNIPKGSRVIVNTWSIGRSPDVWSDPEIFLPERFVENNMDLRGHDFELIPFGSGRRGCPGMQLGLTVVKLVVAQLVHCFDWKLPNGMTGSELDMEEHFGMVVSREKPLMVIPTYRLR